MIKRAFINSILTAVLVSIWFPSILLVSGCSKPEQEEPPLCWANQFTCTIDEDQSNVVDGTVTYNREEQIMESSEWGVAQYDGGTHLSMKYNGIQCSFSSTKSDEARAYYSFDDGDYTEEFLAYIVDGELRWISMHAETYTEDVSHSIEDVVYTNGNLTAYTYSVSSELNPSFNEYEIKYEIDYDLNKTYDKKLHPMERFFAGAYRPILGPEYSLGERFDPQYFSKNLIASKHDVTNNEMVFRNTYTFDTEGRITELFQEFLVGGTQPNSLRWTYGYTCE